MSLGAVVAGVVSTAGAAVCAAMFSADFLVFFAMILKCLGIKLVSRGS